MPKTSTTKKKRVRRPLSAAEKSQAVLSLWTESRTTSEICQELSVSWTTLDQWQQKALEGMLEALKPKARTPERTPALSPRLQKLLERKVAANAPATPSTSSTPQPTRRLPTRPEPQSMPET